MKKTQNKKDVLEDIENLQMHVNNLKAWAGIDNIQEAREWLRSIPFVRAKAYATNHTKRFIQNPYTQLTNIEIEQIYNKQHGKETNRPQIG